MPYEQTTQNNQTAATKEETIFLFNPLEKPVQGKVRENDRDRAR